MSDKLSKTKRAIFVPIYLLSCLTMSSDRLSGYWGDNGTVAVLLKFIAVFTSVFVVGMINRDAPVYLAKVHKWVIAAVSVLIVADILFFNISGSVYLRRIIWIAYVFAAETALYLSVSTAPESDEKDIFYSEFWKWFSPLYVFTFLICFVRAPFSVRTINLIPLNGTFLMLKAFVKNINVSFEAPILFFGNLLIFAPLPFVLKRIFGNITNKQIIAVGILTPFFVEGYQYLFKCGDVDIDDIIFNIAGFLIGYLIFNKHQKRALAK